MADKPDHTTASIQVDIWQSGALSVSGHIGDEEWAVLALQNAIDAVRSHHKRAKGEIIIPGHDTGLGK